MESYTTTSAVQMSITNQCVWNNSGVSFYLLFYLHFLEANLIILQPGIDIGLTVKGVKNVYESLDLFCEVEALDQYTAPDHGQQVIPSTIVPFSALTPLLYIACHQR